MKIENEQHSGVRVLSHCRLSPLTPSLGHSRALLPMGTMARIEQGIAAGRQAPPPARAVPMPFALAQPWVTKGMNDSIHCGICNMWLNGDWQFKDHLKGSKHRNHVRAARALRAGQAMRAITMLLVSKWVDEQKICSRGALLMALKMWAGPRWARAVLRSHVPRDSLGDWVLLSSS